VCTVLAACDVPAESRRTAALDGAHHLQLSAAHVAGVGAPPRGSVVAEDIRDLQSKTGHACRRLWRRLNSAERQRRQPVERAGDRTDRVGGDAGVERGGIELGVPQQS
jgi:hypothetical protein